MQWNWGDLNPFAEISGSISWSTPIAKTLYKSLRGLISTVKNLILGILIDDATILNKLNNKFNLIVTDLTILR